MQALPDTLIGIGFLAFLVGVAWVIVAFLRRRGWKAPAIVTGVTVAVMNIGGILAISDVFGHRHPNDPYFYLYPSTPQETAAYYLMLLGFLALLVGIVRLVWALSRTANRRTAVVVTGLGLAVLVQGGVLHLETYELHHDHTDSSWFEKEFVETAMVAMMADKDVSTVTPSAMSTNSWANNPAGTSRSPLYPIYMREPNTACFYCWDSSGRITRQDKYSATCGEPSDGSVTTCPCLIGMESDPIVGRADYGYVVLIGVTAGVVVTLIAAYPWWRRKRGRYAM